MDYKKHLKSEKMNGIWYYAIAFVLIWVVSLIFKDKLKKFGIELNFPMLMWKTSRFDGVIEKLANISPKFWKWFMNIGIIVSFGGMIFIVYTLVVSLETITTMPSVSLILPGVEVPGSPIFVPFGYGLLAMASVIIIHEFSHGILARIEKIDIKSVGLFLLAILPGAFVEPDEEKMENLNKPAKMRIFAAGSIANLTLAAISLIIIFLISSFAFPTVFQENGITIDQVLEDTPASHVLKSGMVIQELNGHNVSTAEDYLKFMSNTKPNQKLNISTSQGTFQLTTSKNPNNNSVGYMGVTATKNIVIKEEVSKTWGNQLPWIYFNLNELFTWVFLLNLSVGLFNLLPIRGLDGGHLLRNLLDYKLPKSFVNIIMNLSSSILILIIVFSLVYGVISGFF